MRRYLRLTLCMLLSMVLLAPIRPILVSAADNRPEISVFVNGSPLPFELPPTVVGGRTLVPLRAIFEALGAEVEWDQTAQTAKATWEDHSLVLTIGATNATVNGVQKTLDVPGQLIDGRTMVPLRFVGETLGAWVGWYAKSQVISVYKPQQAPVAVVVENVLAGDRLEVVFPDGTREKIALKTAQAPKLTEFYGAESLAFAQERVLGKTVYLDIDKRDAEGNLLARVFLTDGLLFDALLIDEGLAQSGQVADYMTRYLHARSASASRGLWDRPDRTEAQKRDEQTQWAMWLQQYYHWVDLLKHEWRPEQIAHLHPDNMVIVGVRAEEIVFVKVPVTVSRSPDAAGGCSAEFPVKALTTAGGEPVFLTPTAASYADAQALKCYRTAEDAVTAGYHALP